MLKKTSVRRYKLMNKIRDLRIEYRKDPIGIDEVPRFSWKLESDKKNVKQKGYQIQVMSDGKYIWDSGHQDSEQSMLISYEGKELKPMTIHKVLVSVWNNYDEVEQITGTFETGLISKDNWQGQWITHTLPDDNSSCPVFVHQFKTPKAIKSARLYASACGVYEAKINGKKVGDIFMAPGWTSYHHRMLYQTYDITNLLRADNRIEVALGNGWYKGELGFNPMPNTYGDRTALMAMIRIEYEDGDTIFIGTDDSWQVETNEIVYSEIYHGEVQDFTRDKTSVGKAVSITDDVNIGELTAQESEPVRITKRVLAKEKMISPKGEVIFDFGQNLTGLVEVKLPRVIGNKLVVRYAEALDKEGNFYTENLRLAKCTDTFIYGDEQVGMIVRPHFTFHGFRYICVEGMDDNVDTDNFVALVLHTDMEKTGSFSCDNPLVNQLQSNIVWGQRGNFLDIPTDCPQRDERMGWTGDAQVFCGTASYNYNTALFFKKWLRDMAVETTDEWGVPHVVPNILGDQAGAAAWSDAATIIPWNLYQIYGDKKQLEEMFPLMKKWVDYMRAQVCENGLWQTGFQYGDWLALDIESGSTDRTGGTDRYLVANAYYAHSTKLVKEAAKILGLTREEKEYSDLYDSIIEKINEEYITSTGRLVGETQTACILMLYFDLAKPEYRQRIIKTLEQNIGGHNNHLTTGFVGTPYICHCLSELGLHELAEKIFMKEDFPSWLYSVKKGATTIWERWNSILPNGDFDESGMNSLNHYAYGSIGSWLYEKVAGINSAEPGYKKIEIRPILTKGMTEVSASYESMYGTIKSGWSCKNGIIKIDITIPANTTAKIYLPEKDEFIEVGSGEYHYKYETTTSLEQEKYSVESTLGELLAEEEGKRIFEEASPGILDSPLIKFAYDMTITELIAMSEESRPLYQMVIDALNEKVRINEIYE